MKTYRSLLAVAIAASVLSSCKKEDDPVKIESSTDFYVLNNGAWGANNANVVFYDSQTKTVTDDAFASANDKGLGDLGQDILVDGNDVYIAVAGSKVVFVTDADLKIKHEVVSDFEGTSLTPRYLTKGGDKVYVTYYEGFLGVINTNDWTVSLTAVGPNPEGVAYADGKLYVAISGGYVPGYCDYVSVVDAASFQKTSTITVNVNPKLVKACGNNVFVSSLGDYMMIPSMVQCIDAASGKVSDLDCSSPSSMALCGNSLYVLCGGYDELWNPLPGLVLKYDAKNPVAGSEFVKDGTKLPMAYSVAAAADYVFVGCSDYKTNGDVYVFGADGKLYDKFDSNGINPETVAAR